MQDVWRNWKTGSRSTSFIVGSFCRQVPDQASAEYKAVATSGRNSTDDGTDLPATSETPKQPNATHPAPADSDGDQTLPLSERGGPKENTDWLFIVKTI